MTLTLILGGPLHDSFTALPVTEMRVKMVDGTTMQFQVQDRHVEFKMENVPSNEDFESLIKRFAEERDPNTYFINLALVNAEDFLIQVWSNYVTGLVKDVFKRVGKPPATAMTTLQDCSGGVDNTPTEGGD